MADLIDRITFDESITSRPKLNNHSFNGWLRLYAEGLRTRANIVTAWDLQGAESTQAGLLADNIDAETGAVDKMRYVLLVDAISMLLDGHDPEYVTAGDPPTVDKTTVKADLGIA